MCRNIHTLHNFAPPATEDEVRAAALQYVRKISGTAKPSQANQPAFDQAVAEITAATNAAAGRTHHQRPAQGPRGRGRESQGPRRGPLHPLTQNLFSRHR